MKPFRMTQDLYDRLISDFSTKLLNERFSGGKISYNAEFKSEKNETPIQILFTQEAYIKMYTLINCFSTEIGWRGIVDNSEKDIYIIKDILVFPQTVTGATVTTEDDEYNEWKAKLSDDEFNNMRFYGHSHVNMSVTPSTVDMTERSGIISQFGDDGYVIFGIFNKKGDWSWELYDMKTGMVYNEDDLIVDVLMDSGSLWTFLNDANAKVQTMKAKSVATTATTPKRVTGTEPKKSVLNAEDLDEDDNANNYWQYGYEHYGRSYYGGYYE